KIRKILGLSAFVYALIHLLIFVSLDYGFNPKFLFEATIKKPYVYAGLATLLLMTPRAISSFAKFSKYYGSNKVVIDITVYLSQFFACLHYYWLVKADTTWPIIFILVFVLSIGLRVLAKIQQKRKLVASS
ncbi:MAG: ferric reductase-like transmembrane domain-containing protein, partial [Nitrospinota bacterium]